MDKNNKLAAKFNFSILQENFRKLLPSTITYAERLIDSLEENYDAGIFIQLHDLFLSMADAAGTYGAENVSAYARKFDLEFKKILSKDNPSVCFDEVNEEINKWMQQLRLVADAWCKSETASLKRTKTVQNKKNNMIYTLLGDQVFSNDLNLYLENDYYQTKNFNNIIDLRNSYAVDLPSVIIVDVDFNNDGLTGVETVAEIKNSSEICSPVIYIANYTEAKFRLEATRAGADRYFCKPVIMSDVIHTVKGLSAKPDDFPYRVLIVDNDAAILECYAAILAESNIMVETTTDPLKTFSIIEKFKPDVTIIDMFMPDCSGTELVHMIRQDDRWLIMPVLFLSAEQDINNQLDAISYGADDFITKPVHMNKLAAIVNATAKRARKNIKLSSNLKASKNVISRSHEFANIGSWDLNITTGNLFWSAHILPLFGYNKKDTATSYDDFMNAVHPDDRKMVSDAITNSIEKNQPYNIEHRVVWPDGSVHWLHESGDVVRNKDGLAQHMLGVVQDVTELVDFKIRKQANNEILNDIVLEKPLDDILGNLLLHAERILPKSKCSILLLDSSGKYLEKCMAPNLPFSYKKAIKVYGIGMGIGSCGEAAFTGKSVIVSDINKHPNWKGYRKLAANAKLRACWSEPFLSSSGKVLGTFAIYYSEEKEPTHLEMNLMKEFAYFSKIAVERELTQAALMDAKNEAENANHAKSDFLSSMSHELRTPLNAILGFAQLIELDGSLSSLTKDNIKEVLNGGRHLLTLINDVLDLAKIEAGHIELLIEPLIYDELISECISLVEPIAKQNNIQINKLSDYENIVLKADDMRLKQVIINLLSNAIKYNRQDGHINIGVSLPNDNFYRISITDTGTGIKEENVNGLFEAFNRLDAENTEIEGTGIGLVITKNLVELMGGKIGVDSEYGVGSTFWIEIPKDVIADDTVNNSHAEIVTPQEIKDKKKYNVLYIEDNPANLRLVIQLFDLKQDINLFTAHNPMLGLELAGIKRPDLILLDINLPKMNGYQVLEKLRDNDLTNNIPVVAISANAMSKDLKKAEKAGFDDYLTKPLDVERFYETVDGFLLSG